MELSIKIDSTVTFELARGRKVTLESLELADFVLKLIADNSPKDAEGKPTYRADYATLIPPVQAWVKEHGGVEITYGEARGIIDNAAYVGEKTRKNLQPPSETPEESPISQPTTDVRYSD